MTSESFKAQVEASALQAEKIKINAAKKNATSEKITNDLEAKMKTNPIAAIMFGEGKFDEKRQAVAKAIVVDDTKSIEENAERIEALNLFKEFLQMQAKDQAVDMINSVDNGVFGRLQGVIDTLNGSLLKFDEASAPLMAIISSINKLRQAGVTNDAYAEIMQYKADEKIRLGKLAAKQEEIAAANAEVEAANQKIADLTAQNIEFETAKEYKAGIFGILGVKKEIKAQIADNRATIETIKNVTLPELATKIATLLEEEAPLKIQPEQTSKLDPSLVAAKEELGRMLSLSKTDLEQQQQALIDVARGFVEMSDENIASIKTDFDNLKNQLAFVDRNMTSTDKAYKILTAATLDANAENEKNAAKYAEPKLEDGKTEDISDQMERLEKKKMFDESIKAMVATSADTAMASNEIAGNLFTIQNMRDKTDTAIANTRTLQSSGVAQVATGAATALQAINSAAVYESTKSAEGSLRLMRDKTNAIQANEAIAEANRGYEISSKLKDAFDELAQKGDLISNVTTITRAATKQMKEDQDNLEKLVDQVKGKLGEFTSAVADASAEFNAEAGDGRTPANSNAPVVKKAVANSGGINLDMSKI